MMTHYKYENGWEFTYEQEKDGLVFKNVKHQGYNFASQINIFGIWLDFRAKGNDIENKIFVPLNSDKFNFGEVRESKSIEETINIEIKNLDGIPIIFPIENFKEMELSKRALYFDEFYFNYGWSLELTTKDTFFDTYVEKHTNTHIPKEAFQYTRFKLSFDFLFSPKSNTPGHEPSGLLPAARFHPLCTYQFEENPSNKVIYLIHSVSLCYKIDFNLDSFLIDETMGSSMMDILRYYKKEDGKMKAGIFRDGMNMINERVPITPSFPFINPEMDGGRQIFDSAEKPLIYEIATTGLKNGRSRFVNNEKIHLTWDNIHLWNAKNKISTPGGFHAVHIHWHWGENFHQKNLSDMLSPISSTVNRGEWQDLTEYSGSPQFGGSSTGALVDPNVENQNIYFAITSRNQNDRVLKNLKNLKIQTFINAFSFNEEQEVINNNVTNNNVALRDVANIIPPAILPLPIPQLIDKGCEMTYWYFTEIINKSLPNATTLNSDNRGLRDATNVPIITIDVPETHKLNGTVFLHGIFFAHEPESTKVSDNLLGDQHWHPNKDNIKREWDRLPDI